MPNGRAGPAVSHGNMTAMLSQQSALRRGLCLGPSWGQTPSRLTEAATSRRSDICDCGVFPSLRDCIKTNPQKTWLENWVPLTAREGDENDALLRVWLGAWVPPGCKCSASGQCPALQQVGWTAAAPFSQSSKGKPESMTF